MTHFVGMVVVPKMFENVDVNSKELTNYLETILEKFSENRVVPRYIEYTREQAIELSRKNIRDYENGTYADFLEDPKAYADKVSNPNHLVYLREEFPKRLSWTDEQHYENIAQDYSESSIDKDGNIYSTYNPHSRWDWWVVGGRWTDLYRERQLESVSSVSARLREYFEASENEVLSKDFEKLDAKINAIQLENWNDPRLGKLYEKFSNHPVNIYSSIVSHLVYEDDGEFEWLAEGENGWWGTFNPTLSKSEWAESVAEKLNSLNPEDRVVYVNFHI